MIGILSYGVHIPRWRIKRSCINQAWSRSGGAGERRVANFDEDSITMAVSSGQLCLENGALRENDLDAFFFATTTSPYKEKSSAAVVATALDLRSDILAVDFNSSIKASTSALILAFNKLKADSNKGQIMITGADRRMAHPGSLLELNFGDASASFVLGDGEPVARIIDAYSVSDDIIDLWRRDNDFYVRQDDVRFTQVYGFEKSINDAVEGLLEKTKMTPKDITKILITPIDSRSHLKIASKLEFDVSSQLSSPSLDLGLCGAVSPFLVLAAALENASVGHKILLVAYGDGADAILFEVGESIASLKNRDLVRKQYEAGRDMSNYNQFLSLSNMIKGQESNTLPFSSTSLLYREKQSNMRLYGRKCTRCGGAFFLRDIHVCPSCYGQDCFEWIKLSKEAKLYTFNQEYYYPSPDPPLTMAVVDFPEGVRITTQMTDVDAKDVKIGMRVEMCLRKYHEGNFYHNYFWKCRPKL